MFADRAEEGAHNPHIHTCIIKAHTTHAQHHPHASPSQVPFEQVPDLVATRKVLIRGGVAFVAKQDVTSLVVQHFR